ncbi:shikimate dehydrogenase [Nocardioides insulae]|uniref:shikimate dehydrogenase n=1 Tax=Nocardioides insulae TaxID=394734 RepID=UPI00041DC337|nr:shikimate dehydrogenase [Nocardioides insulae]
MSGSLTPAGERYRVGLIGHGIGPSLSPALHMREARLLGLDYDYVVIDLLDRVADLGDVLTRLEEDGFAATNITHPFKQEVLAHVGTRSTAVDQIGAANLVLFTGEGRVAHNTDATGFGAALDSFLAAQPGGEHRGTVVQVGAGGAGLATASALVGMGFEQVVVHDRAAAAAAALAARFEGACGTRVRVSEGEPDRWLERADGVVHVTPVGMKEHPGVAFDVDLLRPDAWLAEVVYRPLETELVRRARRRGLVTLDGGAMAVGQAVDSLHLITGRTPDRERMTLHFDELVAEA